MATKPEFLDAKGEMLVALATVSVAISSPVSLCRNLFLKISPGFPGGILGQANLRLSPWGSGHKIIAKLQ